MEISIWLDMVKQALISEGLSDPGPLRQVIKPGQAFGLVKRLDNTWEMHVRGFDSGTLEAEIEISRDYFEHLDDRFRRDATPELLAILRYYGIPYHITGQLPQMTVRLEIPQKLTPWKPVAALAGIVALLWFLGRE